MPVNHRKVSTAPDIGEPNTIMVSDWNDTMIGSGSSNLLPLLRKTAHPDGMDFAIDAAEARQGINVYSTEEVDNLILTGGAGVPPGGTINQVLTKGAGDTTFWSSGLLDLTFQGRDGANIVRPVIWSDSPNLLKISDGSFNVLAQSDITINHPTMGHRVVEIQTDGGYVPYIRFHRRGVSYWSTGSDGSGFVFSTSAGLDQPKFRIDGNGNLFMPQGQWLHGGGRALIAFDGSNTVVGGYVNSVVLSSHVHASSSLHVTGHTRVQSLNIGVDNVFQGESGRWIAYDRSSDAEMVYAYNTNCCFNEAGGRAWFHRDVTVSGNTYVNNLNVSGNTTISGVISGPSAVKAFARGNTDGNLYSNFGITGWQNAGVGVLHVTWSTPLGQPCVVASCESGMKVFCTATVLSAQVARIEVWTDSGDRVHAPFCIIICGQ